MGGPSHQASPTTVLLLDLAGRRATGRLALGDRTLVLSEGELVDVQPAADDESLEQAVARVAGVAVESLEAGPRPEGRATLERIKSEGVVAGAELRALRRALFVDRIARALQVAATRSEPLPVLEPALRSRDADAGYPLLPVILDAVASTVSESDTASLATQLNFRIAVREGALFEAARAWAGLETIPPRPALSTVLARFPDASHALLTLLRSGLARLEAPGRAGPSTPPRTGTLPPPPPRLSAFPIEAPPPRDEDPLAQLSIRPPRMRLDPGHAQDAGEALVPTELPELLRPSIVLEDPIEELEQRIAELEAANAPAPERARAFVALADVWLQRLGSVERASRALREAAAADPSDARLLQQTALYCHVIGEPALARSFVDAAVSASAISIERAGAQRLRAAVLRAAGDSKGAIEALCEAAADDPGSPEPHELVAAELALDNPEGANAHARLAAAGFQDSQPERAIALLDWAWSLQPFDLPTVYEYASALDAAGRRLAAVGVLARAAELQADPDARRKLRLSAAQRAEAAGRPDWAAELLEDALDAEPFFDLLYAPLDEDLDASGFPEHRACVLEDIATACPEDQRGLWLTRAAQVLLPCTGQREAALWLAFEAALVEGDSSDALNLLRHHTRVPLEQTLLAYALRAAAARKLAAGGEAAPLLRELAMLTIETLDNPEFGLATLAQLDRMGQLDDDSRQLATRAQARAAERDAELSRAELALLEAGPASRGALSARVSALLPDLPEVWPRRIELLHVALASGETDPSLAATLESLYALSRDAAGLASFLEDELDRAKTDADRARLLARLASVHAVREDAPAVAETCERILALVPGHRMAIARLGRAARRLGAHDRWVHALQHRLSIAREPRVQARLLARLARVHELVGETEQAATCAARALAVDAHLADAALVLLQTGHVARTEHVLSALQAVPTALGGSSRAYAAIARAAASVGDDPLLARTLEHWTRLLPSDANAHVLRLIHWPANGDAHPLQEAALVALMACPTPPVLAAVRETIDRLDREGHREHASRLCVRLCEEQGRADASLASRAAKLAAGSSGDTATRAYELWACFTPESERSPVWLQLAEHHAAQRDAVGELRALLRVLEADVAHPTALERLHALFLAAGDLARALSVATLLLEMDDEPAARRARLIELATLAGRHAGDIDRAELYVRRIIAESDGDSETIRQALGVLLALGTTEWAVQRSRAIADGCPLDVRGRIYHWCASTAEQTLHNPALALELASAGLARVPGHAPLLLLVERLTLATDDVQTAMRTYDALITAAIGPHGQRALTYRAGRWLERSGRHEDALTRYLAAFRLEPNAGAAFVALNRVAKRTHQVERVVPCYERLAASVTHETTRTDLLRRAAELALDELDDPERALALLHASLIQRDDAALSGLAERAARRVAERDPVAGRSSWSSIVDCFTQRAQQLWDGPDKVRCLLRIAQITVSELGDERAALASADEAIALAEREDLGRELMAEALQAREHIASGRPLPAPAAPPPRPLLAASRPSMPVPLEVPFRVSAPPAAPARASLAPPPAASSAPTAVATGLDALDQAALVALIEREPWRTDAIRALLQRLSAQPEGAARRMTASLVAVFDASTVAVPDPALRAAAYRADAFRCALADDFPDDARQLLVRLWDLARMLPVAKVTLASAGAQDSARLSERSSGPMAEAHAQVARLLAAADVPVYAVAREDGIAWPIATHPPAVIVTSARSATRSQLLFGLARAVCLAQPAQLFGAVLAPEVGLELLDAARLAFAPKTLATSPSARAKELAAALWQSVPALEQRSMTRCLQERDAQLAQSALASRAHALSARAGLLCSGSVAAALHVLRASDATLRGLALEREEVFADACRSSDALAAVVRAALRPELHEALLLSAGSAR